VLGDLPASLAEPSRAECRKWGRHRVPQLRNPMLALRCNVAFTLLPGVARAETSKQPEQRRAPMLRMSKRALITGLTAVAVAILGLGLAVLQPVSAGPNPTGNDNNSGLSTSNLGL